MGYHVKMEELLDIQQSIHNQIREWDTQLEQVYSALFRVVKTKAVQGKMGESVRSYVTEVHIQLVKALQQMLEEFEMRFSLYAKGYYDIDPSNVAEISQDLLEDQQEKLMREKGEFTSLAEDINHILRSVNDIVSVGSPDKGRAEEIYDTLLQQVITLNTQVGEYEESHKRDGETVNTMIDSAQTILAARAGEGASLPTQYEKGSIHSLEAYKKLKDFRAASSQYTENNYEGYKAAIKQYEMRWKDKCEEITRVEDRKEAGFWQLLGGVMSVIAGAVLIVATAGLAVPLLVGATVVGSVSMLYGLSNGAEGVNNMYLGFKGDGTTVAVNPIRDTFFTNNPGLYYTIGNTSTMMSSLALPLGGVGHAALKVGTSPLRAMAVESGKMFVSGAVGEGTSKYVYDKTGNMSLSVLMGMGAGGISYGGLNKVDQVGDLRGLYPKGQITPVSGAKNPNSQLQKVFDVADDYKLSDDVYDGHIMERHGSGRGTFPNKSKFNSDFDIKKGIDDALRSDKSIAKPNTSGREGTIFEHTFDKPIGTNPKGKPINTIKVVIDESGNVVTAFPKK